MKYVILICSLIISNFAFAWGPTGHRVVGEVAEQFLTKKAKKKMTALLDGESLSRAANWPDKIKSDPANYKYTYKWHYTDWPNEQYDPNNNSGSLITSTEEQIKILMNKKSSKAEKAFAIKFVVHLIGDIHMPLHVGNGKDRGGNNCKVMFHNKATNMHQLWDEKLIEFTRLSFTELSKYVAVATKKELNAYRTGSVLNWARESKDIRKTVYPAGFPARKYCNLENQLPEGLWPKLGYEYSYKFMPILEKRLLQAGVRLAMVLNKAF